MNEIKFLITEGERLLSMVEKQDIFKVGSIENILTGNNLIEFEKWQQSLAKILPLLPRNAKSKIEEDIYLQNGNRIRIIRTQQIIDILKSVSFK